MSLCASLSIETFTLNAIYTVVYYYNCIGLLINSEKLRFKIFAFLEMLLYLYIIIKLKHNNMANLKELELKKGQLVKRSASGLKSEVWQVKEYVDEHKSWVMEEINNGYSYPHQTDIDQWELTTAYDIGIDPSYLPIHEPIDSTGWVVSIGDYKDDCNGNILAHEGEILQISSTDETKTAIWVKNDSWYIFKDLCQPCLPPKEIPTEWTPKEGDLVWLPACECKGVITKCPDTGNLFAWYWDSVGAMASYVGVGLPPCKPYEAEPIPSGWEDLPFKVKYKDEILSVDKYWFNGNDLVSVTVEKYGKIGLDGVDLMRAKWTPKEGDLVWIAKKEVKGRIVLNPSNNELSILYYIDTAEEWYLRPLEKFERLQGNVKPYTGQDAPKIDFGKAGLVLKWRDGLYLTEGISDGVDFICYNIKEGTKHSFSVNATYEDVTDKFNDLIRGI